MKTLLLALTLTVSLFSLAHAETAPEQAVAQAIEVFRKAIEDADGAALDLLTAPELVYGHSAGNVQTKGEFMEEIVGNKPNDYLSIGITDQTVKIVGNLAVGVEDGDDRAFAHRHISRTEI